MFLFLGTKELFFILLFEQKSEHKNSLENTVAVKILGWGLLKQSVYLRDTFSRSMQT